MSLTTGGGPIGRQEKIKENRYGGEQDDNSQVFCDQSSYDVSMNGAQSILNESRVVFSECDTVFDRSSKNFWKKVPLFWIFFLLTFVFKIMEVFCLAIVVYAVGYNL